MAQVVEIRSSKCTTPQVVIVLSTLLNFVEPQRTSPTAEVFIPPPRPCDRFEATQYYLWQAYCEKWPRRQCRNAYNTTDAHLVYTY